MKQHFYTHIIEIDSVYTVLDLTNMNKKERDELMVIIEATVHHVVVDTVLSELSEDDKRIFLKHLATDDHESLWKHLNSNLKNIESKILKSVNKVKKDFQKDIKKIINKRK